MPASGGGASQADVQGHHRSLAEAHQSDIGIGQAILIQLAVEEGVDGGGGAGPAASAAGE